MSRRAFVGLDQAQYIVFFLGSTLGIIRYPTIRRVADAPPGDGAQSDLAQAVDDPIFQFASFGLAQTSI